MRCGALVDHGSIRVFYDIRDLCGVGEEWLLSPDGAVVMAVFFEGDFKDFRLVNGNLEITKGV